MQANGFMRTAAYGRNLRHDNVKNDSYSFSVWLNQSYFSNHVSAKHKVTK